MSLGVEARLKTLEEVLTQAGTPLTIEKVIDGVIEWGVSNGRINGNREGCRGLLAKSKPRSVFWLAKHIMEGRFD